MALSSSEKMKMYKWSSSYTEPADYFEEIAGYDVRFRLESSPDPLSRSKIISVSWLCYVGEKRQVSGAKETVLSYDELEEGMSLLGHPKIQHIMETTKSEAKETIMKEYFRNYVTDQDLIITLADRMDRQPATKELVTRIIKKHI